MKESSEEGREPSPPLPESEDGDSEEIPLSQLRQQHQGLTVGAEETVDEDEEVSESELEKLNAAHK